MRVLVDGGADRRKKRVVEGVEGERDIGLIRGCEVNGERRESRRRLTILFEKRKAFFFLFSTHFSEREILREPFSGPHVSFLLRE